MELGTISKTFATQQEVTNSIKKADTNLDLQQNKTANNTESTGIAGAYKVSIEPTVAISANNQGQNNSENAEEKRINNAIKKSNQLLKESGSSWEFSYQEETERVSIKLIDKETNEVIREIPSEETLIMLEKLWKMTGILIDEQR